MQARKLKALLNNTGYTVAFYGDYIGIGSPLCHDLIKLEIATNKIIYALDSSGREGRAALRNNELIFIWDKLHELVERGEIKELLNSNDVIENPLPVYTIKNGALYCTTTDAYGWPNTTVEGYMMHDNDYFKTVGEAVEYGIKEYEYHVKTMDERIVEVEKELDRLKCHKQEYSNIVAGLKSLNPAKGAVDYNMNNNLDPHLKSEEQAGEPANAEATNEQVAAVEQEAQEQAMESAEG